MSDIRKIVKTAKSGKTYTYWRKDEIVGHFTNDAGYEMPIRKSFTGKTRKEVEDKIDEYKYEARIGIAHENPILGTVFNCWLQDDFFPDDTLAASTKRTYYNAWQKYMAKTKLCNMKLKDIKGSHVRKCYRELYESGCPYSQLTKVHKMFTRFYKHVVSEKLGENILLDVRLPKQEHTINQVQEIETWTDQEIKEIFKNCPAPEDFRLRFLLVLGYNTGCRIAELLALKYEDITVNGVVINKQVGQEIADLSTGRATAKYVITHPKTKNSNRIVNVNQMVLDELSKHKTWHLSEQMEKGYRSDYVFTDDKGQLYKYVWIRKKLGEYYKSIGVPDKQFHTWRHTFATKLCSRTTDKKTVAELLGHDSTAVLEKYYQKIEKEQKQQMVDFLELAL